jgi:hypothetical protein
MDHRKACSCFEVPVLHIVDVAEDARLCDARNRWLVEESTALYTDKAGWKVRREVKP